MDLGTSRCLGRTPGGRFQNKTDISGLELVFCLMVSYWSYAGWFAAGGGLDFRIEFCLGLAWGRRFV